MSKKSMIKIDKWRNLLEQVRGIILSARRAAVRSIDTLQVLTNFEIGRLIVEHEQAGTRRTTYGKRILGHLSLKLTKEFGQGFSKRNLENMRRFYLEYRNTFPMISEKVSRKLLPAMVKGLLIDTNLQIAQKPSAQLTKKAMLSWSHYVFLRA